MLPLSPPVLSASSGRRQRSGVAIDPPSVEASRNERQSAVSKEREREREMEQHRRRRRTDGERAAKRPDVSPCSPLFLRFCSTNAPSLVAARRINIDGALRRDGKLEADTRTEPKTSLFFFLSFLLLLPAREMNSSLSFSLSLTSILWPPLCLSLSSFFFSSLLPPYESWPRQGCWLALSWGERKGKQRRRERSLFFVS